MFLKEIMSIPTVIKLSGVSFYQDNINKLNKDDLLEMVLEPDNKYDNNAIKVLKDGELCGYIPKKYKIDDNEIILNKLIKDKFSKLEKKYNIKVKDIYKWDGPSGVEIQFEKKPKL